MTNKKIDQWNHDYHQQPIPQELQGLVKESIHRAQSETQSRQRKKIIYRFSIGTAAALFLGIVVINTNSQVAFAMERLPLLGALAKAVNFKTYSQADGRMNLNAQIPYLNGLENQELEMQLNQEIERYVAQIKERYEQDVAASSPLSLGTYDVNYQILTDSSKVFSIRIDMTLVKGSAAESSRFFTINKETQQILTLADLFPNQADYLNLISTDILAQMKQQIAADTGVTYFIGEDWPATEQFSSITEHQNFYLNENGRLVIVFDEYEIAPGYMGMPEFVIDEQLFSE